MDVQKEQADKWEKLEKVLEYLGIKGKKEVEDSVYYNLGNLKDFSGMKVLLYLGTFQEGQNKISKDPNSVTFEIYSSRRLESGVPVGQELINKLKGCGLKPIISSKRKDTGNEGVVAYLPIDNLDWKNTAQEAWTKLKETWDRLKSFLDEIGAENSAENNDTPKRELTGLDSGNRHLLKANHQVIYFGAPGTGKSHKLKEDVEKMFGNNHYERVTFYPTYSYAQFVGCYKPVMEENGLPSATIRLSEDQLAAQLKKDCDSAAKSGVGKVAAVLLFADKYVNSFDAGISIKKVVQKSGIDKKPNANSYTAWLNAGVAAARAKNRESTIAYRFVPGPFLRLLVKALNNPDQNYCLVIEEINRANAAAVFGDVFQLLDRGSNGASEYDIAATEDMKKFLKDNGIENDRLRISSNMHIWATMNSADQGVFPLDTAFKRRWTFEYIDIDHGENECKSTVEWNGRQYDWNTLRRVINGLLSLHGVNEDKLMGTFFVKTDNDMTVTSQAFKSKVLMYLWEDAARMCRRQMFGNIKTFSGLLCEWDKAGIEVFKDDIELKKLKEGDKLKNCYKTLTMLPSQSQVTLSPHGSEDNVALGQSEQGESN